jgi:hypothetical protein
MSVTIISTPLKDEPLVTQTTGLSGTDITITFDWSERINRWVVNIDDATGVAIIRGALLNLNVDILAYVRTLLKPDGIITVVYPGNKEPDLATLSTLYTLVFVS